MVDVVIVGFGFAGLATLTQLVAAEIPLTAAVVAPSMSGLGLAYATTDPLHLLNVPADRMGARADEPEGFAAWLRTPLADEASRRLGVEAPGPCAYAPRALFAEYLIDLRRRTLDAAAAAGVAIRFVAAPAIAIRRVAAGWALGFGDGELHARVCVLATGNDPGRVFGELRHPALQIGPLALAEAPTGTPVALIGSGLTAVDAVLTLRRLGFAGEIVALSRHGLLPKAHRPDVPALELPAEVVRGLSSVPDVVRLVRELAATHGWRAAIDALRPHTPDVWQRLPTAEQRTAIERWGPIWNVHRHRMAPAPAARIAGDLATGALRVHATRRIDATVADGRLRLAYETSEGERRELLPAVAIDCTGPQLDLTRSRQPLLRSLVNAGIAAPHPTGLGLAADRHLQVAPGLYAIGSLLTGQRWETIAVPELREQAVSIAAHALDGLSSGSLASAS